MSPLVSVIVPVYNVEKYLYECLNSIINQTYRNLEIIVVDDGSSDNSNEIINGFLKKDNRIRSFKQENKGPSAARNHGIKECHGEYVFFVDSDDFISENMIERFVAVSIKCGSDYVCSESYFFIDGDEQKAKKKINAYRDSHIDYMIFNKDDALKKIFYQKPSITGPYLKLYKRKLFDGVDFPESRYYEDFATTYRFIQKSVCISFIKEKHYAYRIRSNSIMNQKFNVRKMDCLWASKLIENEFANSSNEVKKAACCGIFRINRIVYQQTPCFSEYSREIYEKIREYRKIVLFDNNAHIYERLIAFFSFWGRPVLRISLTFFLILRFAKIKFL